VTFPSGMGLIQRTASVKGRPFFGGSKEGVMRSDMVGDRTLDRRQTFTANDGHIETSRPHFP